MKVVFLGYQTWGCVTLQALIDAGHEVLSVITHPRSNHVYEAIWSDSVLDLAGSYGIPIQERRSVNDLATATLLTDLKPDVIVASDWRTWVSPQIFNIPRLGSLNIHDGKLPQYGGFAPINWAIANGETEVGVTVHFMNDEFDLGDIVVQHTVPVGFEETATDVFHKTLPLFASLAVEALDLIVKDSFVPIPQDYAAATFYHKRSERDSLIDWSRSPLSIYNLIRAQPDPYPNAFTFFNGKKLRIKQARLPQKAYCGTAGRVFCRTSEGVVIVCGSAPGAANQGLVVELVQEEGGPVLPANDYFRRMGDYLGTGPHQPVSAATSSLVL